MTTADWKRAEIEALMAQTEELMANVTVEQLRSAYLAMEAKEGGPAFRAEIRERMAAAGIVAPTPRDWYRTGRRIQVERGLRNARPPKAQRSDYYSSGRYDAQS
jgi:hypothetical protein